MQLEYNYFLTFSCSIIGTYRTRNALYYILITYKVPVLKNTKSRSHEYISVHIAVLAFYITITVNVSKLCVFRCKYYSW